jgi:hypothetical protein
MAAQLGKHIVDTVENSLFKNEYEIANDHFMNSSTCHKNGTLLERNSRLRTRL